MNFNGYSSAEPVQLADGSADGEGARGTGSDERPLGPSEAEVPIVGKTRPGETPLGDPTPAESHHGLLGSKTLTLCLMQGVVRLAEAFELGRCERRKHRNIV